jgi:hypothetical protein
LEELLLFGDEAVTTQEALQELQDKKLDLSAGDRETQRRDVA